VSTIVTLAMDDANQARFDALRKAHYPSHLNHIAAHLTLFHLLPDTEEIRRVLAGVAGETSAFVMNVSGIMPLGRGVAYSIASAELKQLHRYLSEAFAEHLSPQDKQGFRPHVVVQNKVDARESKALGERLAAGFAPWPVEAVGLDWWDYKGGPWALRERFRLGLR
jgi:2'-5' RNA ligase